MRRLDVPSQIPPPVEGHLRLGDLPHQPDAITVSSQHLSRRGRPGFPIMGEFHYGRYPAAEWRERAAVLVLDAARAMTAARGRLWGAHRLVLSERPVVIEEGRVVVYGQGSSDVRIFPAPASATRTDGVFGLLPAPAPAGQGPEAKVEEVKQAGPGYVGGRLVADQFWYGPAWEIGLRRFREEILEHGIEVRLLPLSEGAPVFISPRVRPTACPGGSVLELRSVTLTPAPRTMIIEDER
ncbi:hypothetical protein [Nonomuraea sp. NPDC050786]|uniref:hypothetical protein n=1 Tax=Nonomuraea sp. NPDC050786 TaxID=3154840 RepID=UPI0033E37A13